MDYDFSKLEIERQEIQEFLAKPDAYTSPEFAAKSKRAAELEDIFELKKRIEADEKALQEAHELANDPELGELAREDAENLTKKLEMEKAEMEEKLIPRDPLDDRPAIFEIRALRAA